MSVFSMTPTCVGKSCSIKFLATPTKKRNVYEGDNQIGEKKNKYSYEVKLLKNLAPPLMTALIAFSPIVNPPGGNIIQPGATLFLKDLERNGVDTEEEIYRLTYYGKGRMPGFGQNCTPRGQCTFGPRLQDDEIKLLAEFVKSQADQGWPKIENSGD
ncbi:cytochrome c6, chloroplastic isoform X2 [Nicotiana tomentosiformis]|uniref:cytochrome c6, chloroplastic isoform X2 n=1 Tax=Nicotiana tomentosiformis TaxID=4098 RepID=UPI0014467B79|nr:cytochrome c6, chloroplastic isoform X2 [Nicotiana tomentosiformis]